MFLPPCFLEVWNDFAEWHYLLFEWYHHLSALNLSALNDVVLRDRECILISFVLNFQYLAQDL